MAHLNDVENALKAATENHFGQRDKSGAPYILHVLRVWEKVRNDGGGPVAQVVALLHDTVEDTTVTLDQIRYWFSAEIADAVDAITKRKGETRDEYLKRVRANEVAAFVKFRDATDNFERVNNISDDAERARLHEKYSSTLAVLSW
jgi:(p)ppGpp synthase/HD superfamily hydrolase